MEVASRRTKMIVAGAVVLIAAIAAAIGWRLTSSASGDPGGTVLAQLVPVVSALPSDASTTYFWQLEQRAVLIVVATRWRCTTCRQSRERLLGIRANSV
jgi:hypothetical protein